MKRIIYISFVVLALVATSCTKEEFKPIAESAAAPVWKSSRTDTPPPTAGSGTPSVGNSSGITDPNNDEDGNKRRKGTN